MLGVITETDKTLKLKAKSDIPIGHKVALKALKKGETVIKYGEDIGRMVGRRRARASTCTCTTSRPSAGEGTERDGCEEQRQARESRAT